MVAERPRGATHSAPSRAARRARERRARAATAIRPRTEHRPTVWAVAALAGVSKTTVSRVLTGSPRVSPQARIAVEKAIEKLNYVPNRAARALVTRRADTLALIVSEPETRLFSEPFFAGTVRGINQELARHRLRVRAAQRRGRQLADRAVHHERPRRRRHLDVACTGASRWSDCSRRAGRRSC